MPFLCAVTGSRRPYDAAKLATQLDAYASTLSRADVSKVAKTRGGPELLPELGACAAQLRAVCWI